MASVRINTLSSGEQTWSVLYRHQGRQASRTYASPKAAQSMVELIGLLGVEKALAASDDPEPQSGLTVRELAAKWLAHKARDVQPRTIGDYRRDYDNWVDPFFGHRPARHVTEADVQHWVDVSLRGRLSNKSIMDRHALLFAIFKWGAARTRGLVPQNPCIDTELPKRTKGAPKGLQVAEWHALLEASREVGEDAADLILFLGATGWRLGEAIALMVGDVDDDGVIVFVQMTQVSRKGEGVTLGGKTLAAMRRIDVDDDCAAMLRRRLIGKGAGDLVFTNSAAAGGLWEPTTFRRRYWAKAVELAGLSARQPTPHWLRHTHVAICHASGMSLPEIQRRIGHASIQTTINVYGRTLGDVSADVRLRRSALIGGQGQMIRGQVEPGPEVDPLP